MTQHQICLIGGSGFVGQHLSLCLSNMGHQIRIPSRHPQRHRNLAIPPGVVLIEANIHNPKELANLLNGCDVAINLVGILNERGDKGRGFLQAHVALTEKIIAACQENGIQRLLHMSALNANAGQGPSYYLRSKGEGEVRVKQAANVMDITIFRPSIIFGPGDSFFNRFAALLRMTPLFFPLACAEAKFSPIYVGDVAHCFANAIDNPATFDQAYDLCGPRQYSFRQLVDYTANLIGVERQIIELPNWASQLQANLLEYAPGKPFSRDNYRSLKVDSICQEAFPSEFDITPKFIEAIVPIYLGQGRLRDHFDTYRAIGRHNS